MLDVIELGSNGSLLDIGSGTGSFVGRPRRDGHHWRLVGLDTSPAAIKQLRSQIPPQPSHSKRAVFVVAAVTKT